jgi:hypothetical protein
MCYGRERSWFIIDASGRVAQSDVNVHQERGRSSAREFGGSSLSWCSVSSVRLRCALHALQPLALVVKPRVWPATNAPLGLWAGTLTLGGAAEALGLHGLRIGPCFDSLELLSLPVDGDCIPFFPAA